MADDVLPKPEPKELDEKKALELKHMMEDNVLKGQPYGDERCDNIRRAGQIAEIFQNFRRG
ncbi:MAG TPA: hypothetical protein VK427_26145 [Kofleriaceae bacterium]|nr:hypothetical protein [Kofleriaceae bacterium]